MKSRLAQFLPLNAGITDLCYYAWLHCWVFVGEKVNWGAGTGGWTQGLKYATQIFCQSFETFFQKCLWVYNKKSLIFLQIFCKSKIITKYLFVTRLFLISLAVWGGQVAVGTASFSNNVEAPRNPTIFKKKGGRWVKTGPFYYITLAFLEFSL